MGITCASQRAIHLLRLASATQGNPTVSHIEIGRPESKTETDGLQNLSDNRNIRIGRRSRRRLAQNRLTCSRQCRFQNRLLGSMLDPTERRKTQ
jgi:hypothetical protein